MPGEKISQHHHHINEQPTTPPHEQRKQDFEAIMALRMWSMQSLVNNPFRFPESKIAIKKRELSSQITNREEALQRIREVHPSAFDHDPLFYKALWELMREKEWNIK